MANPKELIKQSKKLSQPNINPNSLGATSIEDSPFAKPTVPTVRQDNTSPRLPRGISPGEHERLAKIRKETRGWKDYGKNPLRRGGWELMDKVLSNDIFEESPYKPTKSTDKNAKYYSTPHLKSRAIQMLGDGTFRKKMVENAEDGGAKNVPTGLDFNQHWDYFNAEDSHRAGVIRLPMGNSTYNAGKDDEGKYISIYDKVRGKEVYDRIYEDEWNKNSKNFKK